MLLFSLFILLLSVSFLRYFSPCFFLFFFIFCALPSFWVLLFLSFSLSILPSHFLFSNLSTCLSIWLTLPTPYDSTELLSFLLPFALSPQQYLVTYKRPACNSSGVCISQRTACFCHVRVTTASCTRACKPLHDHARTHSCMPVSRVERIARGRISARNISLILFLLILMHMIDSTL